MNHRFDLIARRAGEWAVQPNLPALQRDAAKTLHRMAHRFGNAPAIDLVADKSLKVLGCYLCRLTGNTTCGALAAYRESCPLGFAAAGEAN